MSVLIHQVVKFSTILKKYLIMHKTSDSKTLIHTEQGKKWLSQFEDIDKEIAIKVARSLTLVSHNEFERNLLKKIEDVASEIGGVVGLFAIRELKEEVDKNGIRKAIPFYSQVENVDDKSVNALSLNADQGSEARIANIIRQFCKSNPHKYLNHPTISALRDGKSDGILFIDDFIGSGTRARIFLESFWREPTIVSWLSGKQIRFHVIAYSGSEEGLLSVERHRSRPQVHIYRDAPSFSTFGWDRQQVKEVEDIFEKYGRIANKKRGNMWWGFGRGMAAIIFEHGCPNNTPSILWEPDFKGSGWVGLFPNRTVSSTVASVFPEEIVRGDPIKILIDIGQKKLAFSGSLLRRGASGQIILTALALIAKGQRKRSTLSFATGLNIKECEKLIALCIKWKFISVQRRITSKGLAELNTAKKLKINISNSLDRGTDYYYPQQLREATCD